jgi:hypothetical protein
VLVDPSPGIICHFGATILKLLYLSMQTILHSYLPSLHAPCSLGPGLARFFLDVRNRKTGHALEYRIAEGGS